jgi:DNA-binding LytR/AlgR family response regulator
MSKTNILVVEDEGIVAKDIQNSLKKLGYHVPLVVSTGEDALQAVEESNPDLVLMDIMLKGGLSGIDAANVIKNRYDIPVVYLTAYADESTLAKAKISEPYGYIIKPFKEVDLHTTIEMAIYKHSRELEIKKERDLYSSIISDRAAIESIFVRSHSRLVRVDKKDISVVEALKDYVVIHTSTVKFTVHSTMKDIQKVLMGNDFMRVHRSYIIRVDKISSIEMPNIIIECGTSKIAVPIGGSYKDDLMNRLVFV